MKNSATGRLGCSPAAQPTVPRLERGARCARRFYGPKRWRTNGRQEIRLKYTNLYITGYNAIVFSLSHSGFAASEKIKVGSQVDALIVGSGPVGATFARALMDRLPNARILIVEAGPRLSERAGMNVMNIQDPDERRRAQQLAQGPVQVRDMSMWPGTHLVSSADGAMAAASIASCVGGMGAHWSCATPRPSQAERIPFIPDDQWQAAVGTAESLLSVTTGSLPRSIQGDYFA